MARKNEMEYVSNDIFGGLAGVAAPSSSKTSVAVADARVLGVRPTGSYCRGLPANIFLRSDPHSPGGLNVVCRARLPGVTRLHVSFLPGVT